MPTEPEPVRVALADDEEVVRRSLRGILGGQDGLLVVGEAHDGCSAVELVIRQRARVLLLDIRMPGSDGLWALRRLRETGALEEVRVLVLTTFDLDAYVDQALRLGAAGFLLKTARHEELTGAVRAVAAGEVALAPTVARRLVDHYLRLPPPDPGDAARLAALTERERHVLAVLADGRSNAEIAADLRLSIHTVKSHISSLLAKLGLRDREQAIALAHRTHLRSITDPGTPR
jgi:DNA-binding NarL/FixJ family response regulator